MASVGPLHLWIDPEEPPYLDEDYENAVAELRSERDKLFRSVRTWLEPYSDDWFEGKFYPSGRAKDEAVQRQQRIWMDEAKRLNENIFQWYLAGLGRPDCLADFSYWSKMARYEVVELTLLSMGFEPTLYFRDRFEPQQMKRKNVAPTDKYALRRHEMFTRQFPPRLGNVSPRDLAHWVREVDLDAHPAFLRMIDTIEMRLQGRVSPKPKQADLEAPDEDRKPEAREVVSLAKLITAMAIDGYGYAPASRRSPIPKEIQDIADRLGLSLSGDTIRKYLQIGAKYLPPDQK